MATNSTTTVKTGELVFGVFLLLLVIAAIVLNIIVIVIFCRINRMFKNYHLSTRALIINLAVGDLLLIIFYSLPTVVTALGSGYWRLGDAMCKIQIVMVHTIVALNMHMLSALSVERYLHFFRPKLHQLIFTDTTMVIFTCGLWVFDIVIGILPLIGWGAVTSERVAQQLQCTFDYILSVSYQNFSFIIIFVIPLVLTIALIVTIMVKVHQIIVAQGRVPGLQLGDDGEGRDTYITKLVKLQIYLTTLPRKKAKKTGKRVGRRKKVEDPMEQGYGSDSSSDEEITITALKKGEKKKFKFRRSDYVTAVTYFAIAITLFLCWFIYLTINYVDTHSLTSTLPNALWQFAVFFTHLSCICKPILYFSQNYKFRLALIYGVRPWLFKEGPIDLREEMDEKRANENKDEETAGSVNDNENNAYFNYTYEHTG